MCNSNDSKEIYLSPQSPFKFCCFGVTFYAIISN
uniref:Uncharacterized protein n=1 Tax=Arundo donax TaxID=35708 RepID=A0A0A8YGX0_ARUDO